MMDSSLDLNYNSQPSSGLLRFRSAPSTLLANFDENGITRSNSGLIFQEYEDKPSGRLRETTVNYSNSGKNYLGLPPQIPRQNSGTSSIAMDSSFGLVGSMQMNHDEQVKRFDSALSRQSSSPAGLFRNLSIQNGYNGAKIVGTYGGMNGDDGEGSPASTVDGKHGFSYSSWKDSQYAENFSRRDDDSNVKLFCNPQNAEIENRFHILSHHLSLPKTSADMEKFLHFQDSVPCKIRAKRGCATHPRSIAERVRRTRISERMRKLQDLVPNMDKQTNTADMLDLAVDYIKELQTQYKTLSDSRAKCKCYSRQKMVQNHVI